MRSTLVGKKHRCLQTGQADVGEAAAAAAVVVRVSRLLQWCTISSSSSTGCNRYRRSLPIDQWHDRTIGVRSSPLFLFPTARSHLSSFYFPLFLLIDPCQLDTGRQAGRQANNWQNSTCKRFCELISSLLLLLLLCSDRVHTGAHLFTGGRRKAHQVWSAAAKHIRC